MYKVRSFSVATSQQAVAGAGAQHLCRAVSELSSAPGKEQSFRFLEHSLSAN